ncbi:hypothetical protein KK062_02460 [Fulvivirgaceae bacterium PWU5]|uniref:Uncharacterized protein n=1 Tax=Dawidia cretensis TaxID=2782350 RepID=A0AAP2DVB7_9BACT|nr:hypothetical protein [Dawidia cretensis]MBT1707064.1 hypothetical protein [Dawidia cretensis]
MAKQTGTIKLIGKLGGNSYYYTKDNGYLVRKITSVDAERIRTDPAFERVRENNTDFGRCAWGVKLLRAAFIPLFAGAADTRMTSRLTQAVMAAMQFDTTNMPGMRRLESGDMGLLRGFEFNKETSLKRVLKASYATDVNHEKGICTVTITPSDKKLVLQHADASRFRFVVGIARIDFKTGAHSVEYIRSTEISTRKMETMPMVFTSRIMPVKNEFLLITLGIEYLRQVDGEYCVVEGKKYTVLTLIRVEKACRKKEKKTAHGKNRISWQRRITRALRLRPAVHINRFATKRCCLFSRRNRYVPELELPNPLKSTLDTFYGSS